ncbi:hypothetical protein K501DRAFT_167070 [Backusella circina FSU 941]|nr:hypothetical protein K501DRAFT_167070 [Backusella circina FSU 941]
MSFLDEISNLPAEDVEKVKQVEQEKKNEAIKTEGTKGPDAGTPTPADNSWMSWGNNFWNQASAAVKTTTDQINKSVASDSAAKLLENRVKTLQNYVNKENIEKLSNNLKNLTTTFLESVAPPISEHELVEVWLTHDMEGYSDLDSLVYRAFARVMEHTEAGQVVVRMPNEKKLDDPTKRDLKMSESILEGTKLAKSNVGSLIEAHYKPDASEPLSPQTGATPTIKCPVFMAIQPVKVTLPPIDETDTETHQLSFIILMVDPNNKLKFKTCSQSMALSWLDIPYEENEWVEDKMVDIIRMSVTSIAQDYVWTRMSGVSIEEKIEEKSEKV